MKSKRTLLCMLFICVFSLSIFSQATDDRSIISVLDFKGSGISQAEIEVIVDLISSHEVSQQLYNVTVSKFFLAPGIGGGYYFIPGLAVSIHFNLMMIFFDDTVYIDVSPALRVELNF